MKEQKLTAAPKILELDKRSTFLSSIATGDKSHSEDSGLPKMRREIYPPPKKKVTTKNKDMSFLEVILALLFLLYLDYSDN